jgi:hypothetical protein
MPWKCPACHEQIRHSELEIRPRPGVSYRCHICRLELALDTATDKLAPRPMREDEPNEKQRNID